MEKAIEKYHYEIYLEIKTLLIGFAYLFILISASFIYSWFFKDNIQNLLSYFTMKITNYLERPLSAIVNSTFWIDRFGESVFLQIVEGAKFTILLAVAISFFRILCGTCIGILLSLFAPKLKRFFQSCSEVFIIFQLYLSHSYSSRPLIL